MKIAPPALPKGGGAISGIGQSFQPDAFTGAAGLSIPLPTSACRGFEPKLALQYSSGSGNGAFGIGFGLALPNISRKTARAIPRYDGTDTFVFSNVDDLVPVDGLFCPLASKDRGFEVQRYRPRTEGLFARIEQWVKVADQQAHWRVTSHDNLSSIYGQSEAARVEGLAFDTPGQPRVFQWLIERTEDARGNQIVYEYRKLLGNTYVHKIKYGNYRPNTDPACDDWHFEVGFAYSEPATAQTLSLAAGTTEVPSHPGRPRPDPHSSYKSGFEIRTALRCIRIAMAHRFAGEAEGRLFEVSATEFGYRDSRSASALSLLESVTHVGLRAGAAPQAMPPLMFDWSPCPLVQQSAAALAQALPFKPLQLGAGGAIPAWLEGGGHQMVDLYGEGLPGILYSDADTVIYSRPLGDGTYASGSPPRAFPIDRNLQSPQSVLMDLAGQGRLDLLVSAPSRSGYYASTGEDQWAPFCELASVPTLLHDPQRQMVDVTGDGLADLLLFEEDAVTVYPSLGRRGYDRAFRQARHTQPDATPLPITRQPSTREAVHFTDHFGDGGSHLLRIRDGCVECWPNLGHGRFGAKVEMANAPCFGGEFDAARLFLTDVDGSGTTDLVYAHDDRVDIFRNENGNRYADPISIALPRRWNDLSQIGFADVLGKGSACLVFTSVNHELGLDHLYCDFTAGVKPHLLTRVDNNMGASTTIGYSASTHFYLADKAAGRPWLTRLPFPVQLVDEVQTIDHIAGSRLVAGYSYHHGYYDPIEREFRGFGRVDRTDAESFEKHSASEGSDHRLHLPPVLTKTWYHTGADEGAGAGMQALAAEFYAGDAAAQALAETELDTAVHDADTQRDGHRALRGQVLRREVYGLDGRHDPALKPPALAQHPYAVTASNFRVRLIQPASPGRPAVCFVHPREALTWHYERKPADPRITHELTLQVDDFGQVLAEAAVAYGRRQADGDLAQGDQHKQARHLITLTLNRLSNAVSEARGHHTPLPAETRTFELSGFAPGRSGCFSFDECSAWLAPGPAWPAPSAAPLDEDAEPLWRLIEHSRIHYRADDLGTASNDDPLALLPLGVLQPLALAGESYKLALTPDLLDLVYVRDGQPLLTAQQADVLTAGSPERGGYVDLDHDGHWWAPSGRVFLSPQGCDTAAQELAWARQHFYLPHRSRDTFHAGRSDADSTVSYDDHDLLIVEARDALGNVVKARHDYRVLQPWQVSDFNGNRSQVAYDTLGMVAATAVMGKEGEAFGDCLQGLDADLALDEVQAFMRDPQARSSLLLGTATTRIVYDLGRFQRTHQPASAGRPGVTGQPPYVATLARETHGSEAPPPGGLRIQLSFAYVDGMGRALQTKRAAEPGPAAQRGAPVQLATGDFGPGPLLEAQDASVAGAAQTPRWVGSGRTVYNNKGLPVRQYEPFFSATHMDEAECELTDTGAATTLLHDPLGRLVATLHPNQTWDKIVVEPWRQAIWDVNDTVLNKPKDDPDVGELFRRLLAAEDEPGWYEARRTGALGPDEKAVADKAAVHDGTPRLSHFDALGRPVLTVADNGPDGQHETRMTLDIAGRPLELIDAMGRIAMRYDYDLLGQQMREISIDAGARWMLHDAAGSVLLKWDSQNRRFRHTCDALRRPVATWMREGEAAEVLLVQAVYGESRSKPEAGNLRGQLVQTFDQAGVLTHEAYDFKGRLLRSQRQLALAYWKTLDWSSSDRPSVEAQVYRQLAQYDALDRPIAQTAPDKSVVRQHYNRAGLLERVEAQLRGAGTGQSFVGKIEYNARGQRTQVDAGNGIKTHYVYDPLTHRMERLLSLRGAQRLQDLRYCYDPTGNITQIRDAAQASVFFNGQVVPAISDYTYDAVYRLIAASGREHRGQGSQPQSSWNDAMRSHLPQPGDGRALRNYKEGYRYDVLGNLKQLSHQADQGDWSRSFDHEAQSNRLRSAVIGKTTENSVHDAHGNMTSLPHLSRLAWDCGNHLRMSERQVVNEGSPERTWCVYDAHGQRIRHVSLAAAKAGQQPVRRKERVYLGDFEVYREFQADGTVPKLERETLHIIDDQQRMARVETTTKESGLMGRLRSFLRGPPAFIRYTLGNHLGSASLELDEAAKIVSYEEYTPFGSTSYQAVGSQTESARRYRYSGKERDDATGLYYYGARYYAPWLGRWMSADPAGTVDGLNLFAFVRGNPVTFIDHLGLCGGRAGPKPERRNALPPIKVPKKDREGDGHSAMMVRHTFERRDSEGEWETHSARMAAPLVKQAEDAKLNGMLLEYRERVAAPKGLQGFLLEHINLHRDKFKVSPGQGAILGKPALLSKLKTQVEKIDYGMAISLSSRAAGRNADARRTDDKSVIDNVARETDAIAPELGNSGEIRQAIALFLLKAHFVAIADSLAPSRIFSLGAKDEEKEDPKTLRAFVQRGKEMAKDKAKEIASDLFKRVVEQLAVRVLGSVL